MEKVEPEPKLYNFGSATLFFFKLIIILSLGQFILGNNVVKLFCIDIPAFWSANFFVKNKLKSSKNPSHIPESGGRNAICAIMPRVRNAKEIAKNSSL